MGYEGCSTDANEATGGARQNQTTEEADDHNSNLNGMFECHKKEKIFVDSVMCYAIKSRYLCGG